MEKLKKIAVFSSKPYDKEYLESANNRYNFQIIYFEASLNSSTIELAKGFDAVCIFVNDVLDREVIEKLSELNIAVVALRCAGFNNVDLDSAKSRNIKIVRVPSYSPESVAEHAVALVLTLNRKTHKAYNRIRECNFSLDRLTGFNLYKKVVGVIGTGQIGKAFCRIMLGFGCEVLAYDVSESDDVKKMGVHYCSLEELYKKSDIISLHCPLNSQTQYIINEKSFLLMKAGVMIINTSRGKLINTDDVIKALKLKKIGYLGIDVYEQEENLFFNDLSESIIEDELILRLMTFPNVLITSHQAFLTHEALTRIAETTLLNIQSYFLGNPLVNEICRKD